MSRNTRDALTLIGWGLVALAYVVIAHNVFGAWEVRR